jgi:hypothetical protein
MAIMSRDVGSECFKNRLVCAQIEVDEVIGLITVEMMESTPKINLTA